MSDIFSFTNAFRGTIIEIENYEIVSGLVVNLGQEYPLDFLNFLSLESSSLKCGILSFFLFPCYLAKLDPRKVYLGSDRTSEDFERIRDFFLQEGERERSELISFVKLYFPEITQHFKFHVVTPKKIERKNKDKTDVFFVYYSSITDDDEVDGDKKSIYVIATGGHFSLFVPDNEENHQLIELVTKSEKFFSEQCDNLDLIKEEATKAYNENVAEKRRVQEEADMMEALKLQAQFEQEEYDRLRKLEQEKFERLRKLEQEEFDRIEAQRIQNLLNQEEFDRIEAHRLQNEYDGEIQRYSHQGNVRQNFFDERF